VPAPARIALTLGESVGQPGAPLALRIGQELLAEVLSLDAESGRALLSMAGRRFSAHVPSGIEQGQVLRVSVAAIAPDRLTLRLAAPESPASNTAPTPVVATTAATSAGAAAQALDAPAILAELNLPPMPDLSAAVQALVEGSQPLTRGNILTIANAIAGQPLPVESARAALVLQNLGLPVTPRALQIARTALAETPPRPLGEIVRDLVRAGASAEELGHAGLVVTAGTPEELEHVIASFNQGPEAVLADAVQEQEFARPDSAPPADGASVMDDAPAATVRLAGPADARTLLARTAATPLLPEAVRALAQVLHDRIEFQQLANAAALTRADNPPPQRPATGHSEVAGELDAPASPGAPVSGQQSTTLAFSVPLAMNGQFTTLELTVQREPPSRRNVDAAEVTPVRAHFTVSLQRLGEVAADLRLAGSSLRCRISVPPGPGHDLVAGTVSDLRARWEEAGFHVDGVDCLPAPPVSSTDAASAVVLRHVSLDA
jgi:hypothetical protein